MSSIVTAERAHGEAESINEEKVADNILNVLALRVISSLPTPTLQTLSAGLPGVTLERDEGEGKYDSDPRHRTPVSRLDP